MMLNRAMRSRRGLTVALAAPAILALTGCGSDAAPAVSQARAVSSSPVTTAQPAGPEVIDCSFDKPAVRPDHLILACADLGMQVEHIQWQSWGADKAEGDGTERDNTCDPNCAAGHYVTKPVHVVLSDVTQPGNVFTKATTIDNTGHQKVRPLTKR